MGFNQITRRSSARPFAAALLAWAFLAPQAQAVPSFARQTHMACVACHIGGFGPQLTPFGRQFKRMGYTLNVGDDTKIPLSAMLVESYTKTAKAQTAPPADGFKDNDNTELQQVSAFLAGRITDHMGVMAQATYSENGGLTSWDNSDLRYARNLMVGGKPATWGLSLNNNPTVSDTFNTAPAWQYPYIASNLTPTAPAVPMLMGGLAQRVLGLTTYLQLDNGWYVEVGGYQSLSPTFLRNVNVNYGGRITGIAPYARVTHTWDLSNGNIELGAFAFHAAKSLTTVDAAGNVAALPGPTDKFTDLGLDASYQFLGGGDHSATINALYMHESQRLDGTYSGGGSSNLHNSLQAYNLNAAYWYRDTYGVVLSKFASNGSNDLTLYGNEGSPDTRGTMLELIWTPFGKSHSWAEPYANVRLGVQYTWYSRFNGLAENIDGAGRRASDNNTLYLYLWMAF